MKTDVVPQNNPEPAPKERVTGKPKITVNVGEEVIAGTSAPPVEPVVETAPRVAKVAKRKLMVKATLRGKLQQMREGGFERSNFRKLVRDYSFVKVLEAVAEDNEIDGSSLMEQVEDKACDMLLGQAFRYALANPL